MSARDRSFLITATVFRETMRIKEQKDSTAREHARDHITTCCFPALMADLTAH